MTMTEAAFKKWSASLVRLGSQRRRPHIIDRATGAVGDYCIARLRNDGYSEYWNPSGWAGSGYVFKDRKLAEAIIALLENL